jgi:hypothetical protein
MNGGNLCKPIAMTHDVASTCSTFGTPVTYLISSREQRCVGPETASTVAPWAAKSRRGVEEPRWSCVINGLGMSAAVAARSAARVASPSQSHPAPAWQRN